MPGRFTPEERRGIMQRRHERDLAANSGLGMSDFGYTGQQENGASALALSKFHNVFGGGADPTWDVRIGPGGTIQYRAKASTPERRAELGDQWIDVSDPRLGKGYVQKRYDRLNDFHNQFGNDRTFTDFQQYQGLMNRVHQPGKGWQQDGNGVWYNTMGNMIRFTPEGKRIEADGRVGGMGLDTTSGWLGGQNSYGTWGSTYGNKMPNNNAGAQNYSAFGQAPSFGSLPPNPEGPGGLGGNAPASPGQNSWGGGPAAAQSAGFAGPPPNSGPRPFDPNDPMGFKRRKGTLGGIPGWAEGANT